MANDDQPFVLPEVQISRTVRPAMVGRGGYGAQIGMGDGATNAQKTPFSQALDTKVFTRVSRLLQARSGRLPATLVKQTDGNGGDGKTGTIWMVNVEQDSTYTLPQIAVPIHGHEFARLPYKQGDKGFLTTADTDTTAMSGLQDPAGGAGLGSGPGGGSTNGGLGAGLRAGATYARPANLAALVWHPIGNTQFKPQIDPNAHETYGRDAGTITHDGSQKSVVRTHPTDGTVVSSGGQGNAQSASQADGPHKITAHPTDGTKIETPANHTLQASNATLDAQGNQSNQGNSTTAKNITSTGGNVSAPAGAMSAQSGNFATGSIGGMSMAGGVMSGLMAALNTVTGAISGVTGMLSGALSAGSVSAGSMSTGPLVATSADLGASMTVDAMRARKYAQLPVYTVAGLFAALPPSAALAGARVFLSDVRPASAAFAAVLNAGSGGGSNGLCATCDGTNWKTG